MSTKREDIIAATLRVTNSRGFAGTSTDIIAKEANVGKGTIYKYFESKEQLFSSLFNELQTKFVHLIAANYKFDLDLKTNFKNLVSFLINYYVAHDDEFRYLERYSDIGLNISKPIEELTKLIEPITKMFKEANHNIKFKKLPPLVLFAITYGPLVAVVNLVLLGKIELSEELVDQIGESCWESILDK